MINKIFKYTLAIVLFAFAMVADAASEAEFKKLSKTWQLNADGSQEFRYQMELTLFTHTAMNSTYGESFIVYNPKYQDLKINSSYTIQQDGTKVETPSNAFVEVLPKNAAGAPAYNHLKELVVVHTGLDLGATIYLDYTLTSKAGYLPAIDIFETLQQTSPVREYNLEIIVPENKRLVYQLSSPKAKLHKESMNGMSTTSWTIRNVPASSKSDFVQIGNGDVPYLAATTFSSGKEALAFLYNQLDNSANSVLESLAQKLTKEESTIDGKVKSIWHYVNRQVVSNPLTIQQTGFRFRSAKSVLQTVYATRLEKLNLMVGLLNAVGIKAYPLASYPVSVDKGLALSAIDNFYFSVEGTPYLLSTNSMLPPVAVLSGFGMLKKMTDGEPFLIPEDKDYKIHGRYDISARPTGVEVKRSERVGKTLIPYFKKEVDEMSEENLLNAQNGYATFVLPESHYGLATLPYGKLNSQRDMNISVPRVVDEEYTYTIKCDDGISACIPENTREISNSAGHMSMSVNKTDGAIVVKRRLQLYKQLYTPSEYKEFRTLLINWYDPHGKTLIFRLG